MPALEGARVVSPHLLTPKCQGRHKKEDKMSIKMLEKTKNKYIKDFIGENVSYADSYMFNFMQEVINTFLHQSDQIADLRQELAQKQDVIDIDTIKIGGTD